MRVYLIGSLRNQRLPLVAEALRQAGVEVFDDWFAAGPEADDKWREYERGRGRTYAEALDGVYARHTFVFDFRHLQMCDAGVLVMPAGRSAHLKLGVMVGWGKPTWVLTDGQERWDIMYKFCRGVYSNQDTLVSVVAGYATSRGL